MRFWHCSKTSSLLKPCLGVLLGASSLQAQDALQSWQLGETAASDRRDLENQPYTVSWGNFKLSQEAFLNTEFNDNVNLSDIQPQQDVILRPLAHFNASWAVTELNSLTFSLGVGYEWYVKHDKYSSALISPGSQVSWDVFIKDWRLNLHDRLSYEHDPSLYGNISRVAHLGGLFNTAGLTATHDWRGIELTLGYDHLNFVPSSSQFDYTGRRSDFGLGRLAFLLRPDTSLGVETSGGFTEYDQNVLKGFSNLSMGGFADWKTSSRLKVKAQGGWYLYDYSGGDQGNPEPSSYYLKLGATLRLKENINYSLEGGREAVTSIDGALIEQWYAGVNGSFKIMRHLWFNAGSRYENATQPVQFSPNYERFLASAGVSCPITESLSASLDYQVLIKDAGSKLFNYTQNRVILNFNYRF